MLMPHVAARVFGVPLLIDESKAVAILAGIGGRIVDGGVVFDAGMPAVDHTAFQNGRPSMGKLGDRMGRAYDKYDVLPFDVVNNVAVIPIEGTLVHKGSYVGQSSGQTSYQGLQTQVARAARSDAVKGVVFEVDSFGGEVAGAFETAGMIAELSAAKPTIAILTDFALSAGYLMASAARQIVMPEYGKAGSIGVISMHVDMSKKLEKDGVAVTLIAAGKHKAEGNPFEPIPKDYRAKRQAEADAMRRTFAQAVSRNRGGRVSYDGAMATEAAVYGSADALALGLADGIGEGKAAFDAFVAAVNSKR